MNMSSDIIVCHFDCELEAVFSQRRQTSDAHIHPPIEKVNCTVLFWYHSPFLSCPYSREGRIPQVLSVGSGCSQTLGIIYKPIAWTCSYTRYMCCYTLTCVDTCDVRSLALLTLGAHAQRGLRSRRVCLCVCLSVCLLRWRFRLVIMKLPDIPKPI